MLSGSEPRLLSWLKHFFGRRLTAPGRVLFGIGAVVTALTIVTPLTAKLHFVFCALAGIALVSIPLARLARVPLKVDWSLPHSATAGNTLHTTVTVSNASSRRAVDTVWEWEDLPQPLRSEPIPLALLEAGGVRELSFRIELTRRGHYVLPGVRQETWFPFGLWRDLSVHSKPQTLLVYPHFSPLLDLDIPVGRRYQPGGVALSANVGESTEFLGIRQFRPGDSIRNIHWKSWGRVGEPVIKEFQEEFFCKIALVLDTFVPPDSGERYRLDFEASLSMAAAIADHLSQTEYIVDLFAAGPDLYTLESGRNLAHLDNVLDVLACLEPSRDPPFENVAPVLVEHLSTITTVIFVMLDWDQARERMTRLVREHGPAIKTVLVRRSEASLDPAGADHEITVLSPEQVGAGVESL